MDKLVSVKEAAKRLSCSEDTIWKWLKTGSLRRLKVGRLTRINEQDLDAVVRVGLPIGGKAGASAGVSGPTRG